MKKLLAQELKMPWGNSDTPTNVGGLSEIKFQNVGEIINKAIPYILAFAGFGLLLMLISGGYSFLTSAGDAKKLEGGKQRMTNALMGFIIIIVAFWVVQIIGQLFGIETIETNFGGGQ